MTERSSTRYVVVTPVRDEAAHLRATMASVVEQTVRPAQWVVVNDGSTDATPAIIDEFAADHDWITRVDRADRGHRLNGSGVMEAFAAGLDALDVADWEFIVKLDGDLSFGGTYFADCFARFALDDRIGIGGGLVRSDLGGRLVSEQHPMSHVRGATKIYRRACWDDIGGLHPVKGWDTLDEMKATMLGWSTRSFEDLAVVQHRYTGDAQGQLSNWRKNGEGSYIIGYHPLFLTARAVVRGTRRPYGTPTVGLLWGYISAALRRTPRIDDDALIRFVRREQLKSLLGRPSAWR